MTGTITQSHRYIRPIFGRWHLLTTTETFASGQVVAHPRGKQLGGSSAINWMFWTHAGQKDIDNWGALGNAGWSWEALLPYYRRSEHSVGPSALTAADLETQYIIPELHGANGAIYASFPDFYGPLDEAWPRTYDSLGLGLHSDPRDGLALGGYTNLIGVKPDDHTRSYSATGYLAPALGRSNLKVIVDALAQLIVFEDIAGMPTARAVKYTKDGLLNEVYAEGEVILCAGSFGSPQLLELSGIGDAALLTELKISSLVNNPNVGENLQGRL
jgi:choline dehydrogenase